MGRMTGAVWGRDRRGKARGWHSDAASGGKARRDCQGMADRPQSPSRIGRGAAVRSVAQADGADRLDRKSVVSGESGSVRVDLGGRRILKKKKRKNKDKEKHTQK